MIMDVEMNVMQDPSTALSDPSNALRHKKFNLHITATKKRTINEKTKEKWAC